MKPTLVVPIAFLLSLSPLPAQAGFEPCVPGPLPLPGCALAEPWALGGGTAVIEPFAPLAAPVSGFPTAGLQWCVVTSSLAAGFLAQPPGGPALLPYAPGATGQITLPLLVPVPPPGSCVSLGFDYTYVSPECPSDPLYNDCLSVDLTIGGVPVLNLLYIDTFSPVMAGGAVTPDAAGVIAASFCPPPAGPGTRESVPAGVPNRVSVVVPPFLYGAVVAFEVNVADGGDAAFNSWCHLDDVAFLVSTAPQITVTQPGGAGGPVFVTNDCLVPGAEYFNLFTLDLGPAGTGYGPFAGLNFAALAPLVAQLTTPAGAAPIHWFAAGAVMVHGPFFFPPGIPLVFECVCIGVTGPVSVGPAVRGIVL